MLKKNIGIILLILADIFTIYIILQIAISIRINLLPNLTDFPEFPVKDYRFFWWVFPVWSFFLVYEGLYTKRASFWDEIKMLWRVSFFSTLGAFAILYLGKYGEQVSRTVIVLMAALSFPVFPVIRLNFKKLLMLLGLYKSKALILGAGKTGEIILSALKKDSNLGLNVVGFLDDDPEKIGRKINGIKIHAGVDKAHKYIGRCGIEDVILAMPGCKREKLISLINTLQHKANRILLIPDLFGITVLGTNLQHFFQEQAVGLEVKNNLAQPANVIVKKLFDIIASIALLLILIIPIIIISLMIKLSSKGPVIFSQERIGRNDKPFRCYKFRTMHSDAATRLNTILNNSKEAKTEWENGWKIRDDPRITKVGRLLRQTSLDELPQIFNVLKGDMSLVGPRPVTRMEIDNYYKEQAKLCFGVTPGLTGLWQVSGRSNTSYDYRIALDSWYVRNWNLWLDIVILLKTVKVVLKREGAV